MTREGVVLVGLLNNLHFKLANLVMMLLTIVGGQKKVLIKKNSVIRKLGEKVDGYYE